MAKQRQPKTGRIQRWRERRRRAKAERAGRIHSLRTVDKFERYRDHVGHGPAGGMF